MLTAMITSEFCTVVCKGLNCLGSSTDLTNTQQARRPTKRKHANATTLEDLMHLSNIGTDILHQAGLMPCSRVPATVLQPHCNSAPEM